MATPYNELSGKTAFVMESARISGQATDKEPVTVGQQAPQHPIRIPEHTTGYGKLHVSKEFCAIAFIAIRSLPPPRMAKIGVKPGGLNYLLRLS